MTPTELLLHPVRLRIVFAATDGLPFTTSEMCLRLPDVSKATVYRHVALLAEGGLLEVESEELVRGIVERHYQLLRVRAVIDPAAAAAMTKDDHRKGFAAATASLLAEFNAYLDEPQANPTTDSVSYRQFPLWLSEEERSALVEEVSAAVQARLTLEPTAERKRHLLSTVFFPAEPHRKAPDLTVLRELADDGNEEAEARLTHLAVQRGDVEQLRRLADDGNEEAARRLTELAVDRGDIEQLRRLADEGNDEAERQLAKFIRDFE
jgi:DNA-binding transcriptional ArsR family regulator